MAYLPKPIIDLLDKIGLRRPPDGGRLRDAAVRAALHKAGFTPGKREFFLSELSHFGLVKVEPKKALQK
jgi:hypothetical protein